MDPILFPIVNSLAPILATLAVGGSVVGFYWVGKHYRLREKEIELEAELHGKRIEAQLRAMEVRLAAGGERHPQPIGVDRHQRTRVFDRAASAASGEGALILEASPLRSAGPHA
jgi:hypothetical protein